MTKNLSCFGSRAGGKTLILNIRHLFAFFPHLALPLLATKALLKGNNSFKIVT